MNQDKIRSLDDREKSREKISVWYGSRDNYTHGVKEVIANATDEVLNNFDHGTVTVTLHDDLETITVSDTGRGIPIDGETDGVKNYELLFRTLFAGTKYETTESTLTGTNGVGNTVLCYTSELFAVKSYYNGKIHSLEFINGGELSQDLKIEKDKENRHGTEITFKLDKEVYPIVTYEKESIEEITRRFAIGSPNVTTIFKYKDEERIFHYDSAEEYFSELIGDTNTSPIVNSAEARYDDEDEITKIKLVFTTTPETVQESYLNLTYLQKGGAFNEGVLAGIRLYATKHCREARLFPKGFTAFNAADIESSISFICIALSNKVEFENQTKLSTDKKLYRKIAQKHVSQMLEVMKIENPSGFNKFINHLLTIQKHNNASQKAKAQLKKKLTEKVEGIGNKVLNLVDCKKHGAESELFIAEGQSALGSIVLARDPIYQAAYPLRGKILNCLKADYVTIFKNQIITDLVKVLGCGIETDRKNKDLDSFDLTKLRFGKIIIATDADPDGAQIAALIITMIYRLMPKLIEQGYIYIALTPLYEVKLENDQMVYFFSEKHKDDELPKIKGKYVISRCKGLGELDPLTMSETAMDPDTRQIVRVTVDDLKEMQKALDGWMGIHAGYRKDFIGDNLYKYVDSLD